MAPLAARVVCVCCLLLVALESSTAVGNELFLDTLDCHSCRDRAENSTCGDPFNISSTNVVKCKRGACVKWAHYVDGELIIERTCSKLINMRLQLVDSCRTERDGNGYLCMCGVDMCNAAPTSHPVGRHSRLVTLLILATMCVVL